MLSSDVLASYRSLFHDTWIGWLCRAGYYCLGLSQVCPIGAVLCVDDSPVDDLIRQREGIPFFSIARFTGRRNEGNDSAADEIVPRYRVQIEEELRRANGKRHVLASSIASQTLEAFAAEGGYELIANPSDLIVWLNDKQEFLRAIGELGLPRLAGRWTRLTEGRYGEIASEMGSSFVAQRARGVSGSGTAFIGCEEDYRRAGSRFGDAPVWIARDLGRLSLNINALACASGTVVSYPSVQLEGLSIVNASRGMYCGNDYLATADLPRQTVNGVIEQTRHIGKWLGSLGYRGLFGLDFVLDQASGLAYAVDLNPRWQGSTVPLTLAECKAGRLPLAVADLACRMGLLGETEILGRAGDFLVPVRASHISLRCPVSSWWRVTGALKPGVYSIGRDGRFLREGLRLSDLEAGEEILVNGGVPRTGALLAPKSHAMRFSSERGMVEVSRAQPLPWVSVATERLYAAMALAPVSVE